LPALLRAQRRHLGPTLLVMLLLCGTISAFIAGFRLDRLASAAMYSYPIGFCCWGLNALGRVALAAAQDALDRLQGRAPRAEGWGCGWSAVIPSTVLGLLVGPSLGMTLGDAITGLQSPSLLDWSSRATQVTLGVSLVATMLATWAISSIERLASAREAAQAAQRVAAENQLRLLQSQLEPHMLFNTLANLRVLIGLDAAAAQQMLDRLIAFLRATLEASRTPAHPLATEFERVADYLALMAIRMGPRLQVALDLPPELAQHPVPPLLLQPLVENAIRHGLEPQVAGGRLEVRARAEGGSLVLSVRDTGIGLAAAAASGTPGTRFGLAQVRERLATLHGAAAGLRVEPAAGGDGTLATVWLPLQPPGAAPTVTPAQPGAPR
jgi:signal transduction histidine kinase